MRSSSSGADKSGDQLPTGSLPEVCSGHREASQSGGEQAVRGSLPAAQQGGVGAAGVVLAQESMKLMLYAHWDKFHRVIRDINLALNRSTSGLFLKTRIFSAHLWSLNHKPWGTGLFGTQKEQLLNAFMGTQSPESSIFRKYAPSIAKALDRSLDTPEDHFGARWRS